MNDRKLLELAAKAAGIRLHHWDKASGGFVMVDERAGDDGSYWNPRDDDGDAFRLAVELRLDVAHYSGGIGVTRTDMDELFVPYGNDPNAAARLAIVRAAAEIGKGMK